jgi:uncharacterized protein
MFGERCPPYPKNWKHFLKTVENHVQFIRVKVKPNARASSFAKGEDDIWLAHIKAPPEDGKANEELIALVAKHFGCNKSAVSIKSGSTSRNKLVKIAQNEILRKL